MNAVPAVGVIPSAPQEAAVRQHAGVEIVTLVERGLMDARVVVHARAAVDRDAVHGVQNKRRFLAIFVLRFELRATLENLDRLRFMLASGGKQNAVEG